MIPRRVCHFDVETTGLNPEVNGLIQLAMIIEIDGEVVGEKEWKIKPFVNDRVDPKALEVNGINEYDLQAFQNPEEAILEVKKFLRQWVNPFNRDEKFTPCCYNAGFDTDFLRQWFVKGGDKYYGSWFTNYPLDPYAWVHLLVHLGLMPELPNRKLVTVCEHFSIPLGDDAHDAMADIKATRGLALRMQQLLVPPEAVDPSFDIPEELVDPDADEGATCAGA